MRLKQYIKKHHKFVNAYYDLLNKINPRNRFHIGKTNRFSCKGVRLNGVSIHIIGSNNIITVGRRTSLRNCSILIKGDNNCIDIGNAVILNETTFWIEDKTNSITIGDDTTVSGKTEFSAIEGTSIIVGKDCMFSRNIRIVTGDSHSIINNLGERINPSKNITIGDHVWVGADVVILKGARVNSNSIIGTRALVNKEFQESNIVLAGTPARKVKEDVDWDRIRINI